MLATVTRVEESPASARWIPAQTFVGDVAVVTGGGTGLGLEISRGLAALGARVVVASRSAEHHAGLLEEAERRGWLIESIVLDVREPKLVRELIVSIISSRHEVGNQSTELFLVELAFDLVHTHGLELLLRLRNSFGVAHHARDSLGIAQTLNLVAMLPVDDSK